MHHKIEKIFKDGTSKGAGIKEEQEMLSLFHRQDAEYELKSLLFDDLEETTVVRESLPELSEVFSKLWDRICKSGSDHASGPDWIYPLMRIAAALVIGLFLGIYITSLLNRPEPASYTAHSPAGSVSEWTLPDGTVIFLNAGSELKYSAAAKGPRTVHLTGEAWFNVMPDKKRPFIVNTQYYDVEVTGTKFNVKAYEDDREVVTTLEEGEIILMPTENLQLGDKIILKPGDQAVFDKNIREMVLRNVNTRWYTSWKDNKLVFMNMDLKDLIILLERKYGVEIVVKNQDILTYHCDGTFKNETIIEVLEIIKKTLPISYKIVGQQIEITSK